MVFLETIFSFLNWLSGVLDSGLGISFWVSIWADMTICSALVISVKIIPLFRYVLLLIALMNLKNEIIIHFIIYSFSGASHFKVI